MVEDGGSTVCPEAWLQIKIAPVASKRHVKDGGQTLPPDHSSSGSLLPLPVADAAAGPTRPGLDACIHRLGIQGIAMVALGQPDARGAMPSHACDMRRPDGANLLRFDLEIVACPGGLAAAIAFGLDRNRRELRRRPERRLGEHGLGQIEAEEIAGTIVIRKSAAGR